MMIRLISTVVLKAFFFLILCSTCMAAYEIRSVEPRIVEDPVLDIALSPEGGLVFVLCEGGVLTITDTRENQGGDETQIQLPFEADRLAVSPEGDKLIATRSGSREVYTLLLDRVADIDITSAPKAGPESAPVTISVFSEFQCPYCASIEPLLSKIQDTFPDQVRIAFKHYPLQRHPYARQAALASIAAQEQGKFWELHDLLFDHQDELNPALIEELANRAGLDMDHFQGALNDSETLERLNKDLQDARNAGVRGTPTLFVNGRLVKNRNFQSLRSMIQHELENMAIETETISQAIPRGRE